MLSSLYSLDFALNLLASLTSSIIFIFILLFWFRPQIKICPQISIQKDTFDKTGRSCYLFKIVNLSLFSAYDIHVELNSLISYPGKGGTNFRFFPLQLKTDKLNFIAPYRPQWIKKTNAQYAMIFRTYENLMEIVEQERNSIQLQVTLKHGLTGLSKVFNMEYVTPNDIIPGQFTFGNTFNIV